jgi:hypothetical protein
VPCTRGIGEAEAGGDADGDGCDCAGQQQVEDRDDVEEVKREDLRTGCAYSRGTAGEGDGVECRSVGPALAVWRSEVKGRCMYRVTIEVIFWATLAFTVL